MAKAGMKAGLMIDIKAKPGMDEYVEEFLHSVLPLAREDATTQAWIAVRFARDRYGVFDVFSDGRAREAHINGPLLKLIKARKGDLFSRAPELHKIDVIDDLMAPDGAHEPDRKGFLLTFRPRPGREADLEKFLRENHPFVLDDPKTSAWFAVRLDDGTYGIFDVFPDSEQIKRLTGRVPNDLARRAGTMIKGRPTMDMLSVTAEKLTASASTRWQ